MVSNKKKTRIAGVHRVKKKLSGGSLRTYHYVFRGGPKFWSDAYDHDEADPQYVLDYQAALNGTRAKSKISGEATRYYVERYRNSAEYRRLKPRTQSDYEKYLRSFEEEFGVDPIKMFEEIEAVGQVREWRSQWSHSPKQ